MRTIDRLKAGQVGHMPAAIEPEVVEKLLPYVTELATLGPAIVADNVAEFIRAGGGIGKGFVLEELPSLAPPWPAFWIESRAINGVERRGILVLDVTEVDTSVFEESKEQATFDAVTNGFMAYDIRWHVAFVIMIEADKVVGGPLGWFVLALDGHGRVQGNAWMSMIPLRGEGNDATFLSACCTTAFQTVAFLHCKNIVTDTVVPPPKLSKRHQERHGAPLTRYHTLRIAVPGEDTRRRGGTSSGTSPSLHIRRGSFSHYGNCCPGEGGHPPNGKLFGKLEGVYFIPDHVRGNKDLGTVVTDFEIEVRE